MRKSRDYLVVPNVIIHAFNRGVNRGQLFHCAREYDRYMECLLEAQKELPVSLLVHTLMPNHVHLILQQHEPYAIPRFMKKVSQSYAQWLNRRLNRSGHVFQGRYGGGGVADAAALLRLSHYIHTNAVTAGLVSKGEEWRHSSCNGYINGADRIPDKRSLLWSLVGGPVEYARFLEEFDTADPESADTFLCPEAAMKWGTLEKSRGHMVSR